MTLLSLRQRRVYTTRNERERSPLRLDTGAAHFVSRSSRRRAATPSKPAARRNHYTPPNTQVRLPIRTLAPRFLCGALEPLPRLARNCFFSSGLELGVDDVFRSAPRLVRRVDGRCVIGGFGGAPSARGRFRDLHPSVLARLRGAAPSTPPATRTRSGMEFIDRHVARQITHVRFAALASRLCARRF